MLTDDKVSIEHVPVDDDNIIAIATSSESSPAGFSSQDYDGEAYGSTANPLAVSITSAVQTAL